MQAHFRTGLAALENEAGKQQEKKMVLAEVNRKSGIEEFSNNCVLFIRMTNKLIN